ncbi:MAG: DUF4129 domain-containing protein [Chloroflexi bacterium]|nr:DUF4129 domain-containing protein [Chloroflexota bacterium]
MQSTAPSRNPTRAVETAGLILISVLAVATVKISEVAGWMELPRLLPLSVIALAMAVVMAKMKPPAWVNYPASFALCVLTTFAFGASAVVAESWAGKGRVLVQRLHEWWEIVSNGETAKDNLPLVLLLLGVMWLISYSSVRLLLRPGQKWLAIAPSAVWILLNVRYIPQGTSFYYGVYLAALALFLAHLRLKEGWGQLPRFSFLGFLAVISIPLLVASWALPQVPLSQFTGGVKGLMESRWGQMETTFNRYFSPNPAVETNAPAPGSPLHTFGPELVLKGTVNPPESRVMTVLTPVAGYLRGATYEVYTGSGWKQADPAAPAAGKRLDVIADNYLLRRQFDQTIDVGSTTDVVFSVGQPISANLNSVGLFPTPMSFTIPIDGSLNLLSLPEDVQKVGQELAVYYTQRRAQPKSKGQTARPPTPGFNVRRLVRENNEIKAIELVRQEPDIDDVLAVRSTIPLRPGNKYVVTSSVSTATYVELQQANDPYPSWVSDRYIQLPRNLPDSVRQISYELTRTATNSYDKALAIEIYLRQMGYSTTIKTPPPNVDVVEYFLFKAPEGYCNYFATAMVVMLRSVGVPARMVAGFNQGEYDLEQEAYVIRESNAHAWPEVFFPAYGWVEFEPTPSQPTLGHEPPGTEIPEEEPEELPISEDTAEESWISRQTGLVLLGSLAIIFGMGLLVWNISLRGLSLPAKAYEKMRRLGFVARVRRRPWETPAEYARRLMAELPVHSRDIETITGGYVEATFGKKTWDSPRLAQIELSWRRLRSALLSHALRLG